ncbi:hypothetical protein BTVI_53829 [Pitangus sulphuratus]|nr:hypothetical protein BTVI_53829 [Pitangus sulphuratus]
MVNMDLSLQEKIVVRPTGICEASSPIPFSWILPYPGVDLENLVWADVRKSDKNLGEKGACRGSFCEKLQEASPMPDRANASLDLLLSKAISKSGSASVIKLFLEQVVLYQMSFDIITGSSNPFRLDDNLVKCLVLWKIFSEIVQKGFVGLCGQVLVAGQGYTGVFYEKLPEASPCPTEPMPVGSKMDPLLAKAEPIRNDSVITYLEGKKVIAEK